MLEAARAAGLDGGDGGDWMAEARRALAGEGGEGVWPRQCAHVEEDGSWRMT